MNFGKRLNYQTTGNRSKPAVLLLHGFMGSSRVWDRVSGALAGDHFCIAIDLPGHGASVDLESVDAYTIQGTAQALVDILDTLDVARCTVVGYSMGGRLALYFALYFPTYCERLVLESSSPGLASKEERALRCHLDEDRARRLESENFRNFLDEWYRQPLFSSLLNHDGLVERLIQMRKNNDPGELARNLRGMGTGTQPSLWNGLSRLGLPTFLLVGDLDSKYKEIAKRMHASTDKVQVAIAPGAGHNIHLEQPDLFLSYLLTFLNKA